MKASKESSSRLCPLGDVSLPAARWGVSAVASRFSDVARRVCVGVPRQVHQGDGARTTCG